MYDFNVVDQGPMAVITALNEGAGDWLRGYRHAAWGVQRAKDAYGPRLVFSVNDPANADALYDLLAAAKQAGFAIAH
jgi:hypothetical protein